MSDQSGVSIFDAAAQSANASFPPARRGGYDPDAVDAWVRSQSAELTKAAEAVRDLQQAHDQLARTNEEQAARIAELTERVEAVDRPSYAGLGNHAAQLLGLAEAEAAEVRERATREAAEVVASAHEDAALLRAEASAEVEELRTTAVSELEAKRKQLLDEAHALHTEATATAADLRDQAD